MKITDAAMGLMLQKYWHFMEERREAYEFGTLCH